MEFVFLKFISFICANNVLLFCFIKLKLMQNKFSKDDFIELHSLLEQLVIKLFDYCRYLRKKESSLAMRDLVRGLAVSARSLSRYISMLIEHGYE